MKQPTWIAVLLLSAWVAGATGPEVTRPMIWVSATERAPILAKIQAQPWAAAAFEAMKARASEAVAQHEKDPETFLRGLPLVSNPANPKLHPTLAHVGKNSASGETEGHGGSLQKYLLTGQDCGVLYFLTQDEAYARCAADILHAVVEAMVQMQPSDSVGNGGLIYPEDHLYEARALGAQIPLIYDFVYSYLKSGATVYNLAAKGPQPFNFEHAQTVFRTYARLALEHGIINCNWPVLEMPSLAHNVLALDNASERARLWEYVLSKDTDHQDSLRKVVARYAEAGAVWPESLQYSSGVSTLATYLVALTQRQDPSSQLPTNYLNIPLSLAHLSELRFPNGENIRFGDSPREGGGAYASYEIAYALGLRRGDTNLQCIFGGLINLGIAQGKYDRATPRPNSSGANVNLAPLQLLWFAPEVRGQMSALTPRTTDELPFVGAVLQRNLSPDQDPAHALMAVVSGGHHVHGHASGMALELYGVGQVLGANAGKGTYGTEEHENYRRLFAAYNSVIVNGASRSAGGWANLGINTVQTVALEPAVGAAPVSRNHSFTLTSFLDDKGPNAKAKQERLVGLVRTSARTGYYVDVFRSESALTNQFHDYLYHNIGDQAVLRTATGELTLVSSPGRFVPVPGAVWKQNRSFLFPGWHVFKDVRTSASFAKDVTVDFCAEQLSPAPAHMRLFVPGAEGREYSSALAPATKDAPGSYGKAPTPVLIIRQRGQAWTRPFAVVYEPFSGSGENGSVQSATALEHAGQFAGFKVVSKIDGATTTQYVLVQPSPTSVLEDTNLGISFHGRFAVISVNAANVCTALYLGEGSQLGFKGIELTSVSGVPAAAYADLSGQDATLTANSPVALALPDGRRIASASANRKGL